MAAPQPEVSPSVREVQAAAPHPLILPTVFTSLLVHLGALTTHLRHGRDDMGATGVLTSEQRKTLQEIDTPDTENKLPVATARTLIDETCCGLWYDITRMENLTARLFAFLCSSHAWACRGASARYR